MDAYRPINLIVNSIVLKGQIYDEYVDAIVLYSAHLFDFPLSVTLTPTGLSIRSDVYPASLWNVKSCVLKMW